MGFPSLQALPPMLSERHDNAVVVWAPAKVNLFLEVLAETRTAARLALSMFQVQITRTSVLPIRLITPANKFAVPRRSQLGLTSMKVRVQNSFGVFRVLFAEPVV